MRTYHSLKKDVILGISAGERKKKKPRIRRITGLSVNDIKQIMQDRKKVVFINVLNSKKKEANGAVFNQEDNGKTILPELRLVHP